MLKILQLLMIAGMLLLSTQVQSYNLPTTLKTLLEQHTSPAEQSEVGLQLSQKPLLLEFYQQRDYQPAWVIDYRSAELISQLLSAINSAEEDGLDSSYQGYHKNRILQLSQPASLNEQARLDMLLTDAFMALGTHLYHGIAYKTEADTLYRTLKAQQINLPQLLEDALQHAQVKQQLANLAPAHTRYRNLKKALLFYQQVATQGGWNTTPESYLDPEQIKSRLSISGEFDNSVPPCPPKGETDKVSISWSWDESKSCYQLQSEALIEAVKLFQRRQNITVDGVVGPKTQARLAESVHQVIERIRLNLERWRWFNPLVEDNYVMVNIPDFSLQYVQDGQNLSMQVVVGKTRRPTPIMQAQMSHMVFNPYWRIPKTILKEDILPKLRQSPEYLNERQIRLFKSSDTAEKQPLDASTIDWDQISPKGMLSYIFRQDAGTLNPLGSVKFIFPNGADIYIHDTSARYLFKNKTFLVSSGCIRAEKPLQLAHNILKQQQPEVTFESTFEQIQSGQRQVVWLQQKIPVYVTYQTAWADESGTLYQRKDVYKRDENLRNHLKTNLKTHIN